MRVLLTGAAGFIGFHAAQHLLKGGHAVCGYDNLNDYYDPAIKHLRLETLRQYPQFSFNKGDLQDQVLLEQTWNFFAPDHVLHLAAQAGVRYSLINPHAYIHANIIGFQNVLELVRHRKPHHFVYASSSSVYGNNKTYPFSEDQDVSHPISLYAATKIANELFAKTYGHLYDTPSTGLRFFTVYGPYSRPDMAMFKFAELISQGQPIPVFNHGEMERDFTYVDDIVQGVLAALEKVEIGQIYNLGRGSPMKLWDMIKLLEGHLGCKAKIEMLPMQAGDVPKTLADISKAKKNLHYTPATNLEQGVAKFASWYREYRQLKNRHFV